MKDGRNEGPLYLNVTNCDCARYPATRGIVLERVRECVRERAHASNGRNLDRVFQRGEIAERHSDIFQCWPSATRLGPQSLLLQCHSQNRRSIRRGGFSFLALDLSRERRRTPCAGKVYRARRGKRIKIKLPGSSHVR